MNSNKIKLYQLLLSMFNTDAGELPLNWSRIEYVPNMGILITIEGKRVNFLDSNADCDAEASLSRLESIRYSKALYKRDGDPAGSVFRQYLAGNF